MPTAPLTLCVCVCLGIDARATHIRGKRPLLFEPCPALPLLTCVCVCGTSVWTQSLHLEPLHQPFYVINFFRDRVSQTICLGGFEPWCSWSLVVPSSLMTSWLVFCFVCLFCQYWELNTLDWGLVIDTLSQSPHLTHAWILNSWKPISQMLVFM
jgi:hypothetical protein